MVKFPGEVPDNLSYVGEKNPRGIFYFRSQVETKSPEELLRFQIVLRIIHKRDFGFSKSGWKYFL